jgi:UDP-N-acetylmuramate dehydrogenase
MINLLNHIYFKQNVIAKELVETSTREGLISAVETASKTGKRFKVIGAGSNIYFTDAFFDGTIIKNSYTGFSVEEETDELIIFKVSSGHDLEKFIEYTVDRGYWGLENLSLIPGCVGALPVQNVGAYGQYSSELITSVTVLSLDSGALVELANEECRFGFRTSIFNGPLKDKYVILEVNLRLWKRESIVNSRSEVRAILDRFETDGQMTKQQFLREEIKDIRSNGKNLPNDSDVTSCGTFFRAIEFEFGSILKIVLENIYRRNFSIAGYLVLCVLKLRSRGRVKVPANRLIRSIFPTGLTCGSYSLFLSNPAVVLNAFDNQEDPAQLRSLIDDVILAVEETFGIKLVIEPEHVE